MKRIGLLIFFICIILFSFFIRRKEGFLATDGSRYTMLVRIKDDPSLMGICYNTKNNTLYVASNTKGCVYAISPSATASSVNSGNDLPPMIISPTKTIANMSTKLIANATTGPWGICCDNDGNLYVTDQNSSNIIKIEYSTITANSSSPSLFVGPPGTGGSRPRSICYTSDNNIWVVYTTGNLSAVKYNLSGALLHTVDLGFECSAMALDYDDNVYVVRNNPAEVYKIDKTSFSLTRHTTSTLGPNTKGLLFDIYRNMFVGGDNNSTNIQYVAGLRTLQTVATNGSVTPGNLNRTAVKFYTAGITNPSYGSSANPSYGSCQGFCLDPQGNLYSTFSGGRVLKMDLSCVDGQSYSSTGKFPCKTCPTVNRASCPINGTPTCVAPFSLDSTGEKCIIPPCTVGTNFSLTGNAPCTRCPANATCSTATPAGITCATNYTIANSGTVNAVCNPTPCTAGTYSISGGAPCRTCPLNNATCGVAGTPTCQTNLQYDSLTNTCKPIPCTAGNYSATGNQPCTSCPTTNLGTCGTTGTPTCASGFTLSATGTQCLTAAAPCPIGTYSSTGQTLPGQTTCPNQCPVGHTTISTGASNINQCVRPITRQDVISWLNTNNFNIITPTATTSLPANAKYYGLQTSDLTNFPTTNIPTVAFGATYSGSLASIEPLLNSAITSAALKNYANKTLATVTNAYYLTNSQGQAVNGSNLTVKYPMTSIPFSKGSLENQTKNILSCTSMTDPKSCTYKWAGTSGPISANPCPALNGWFDFDQEACVDALGKKLTSLNSCSSSSVYNQTTNACVPVRTPVKTMPPKTTGSLGTDDYNNCKTIDQGDCTVLYKLGSNITTTNPCSGSTPNYNFETNSCVGNPCCSMTASQAAANPSCAQYVQSSNVPSASCTNPTTAIARSCCQPANASKPQCASYYTKTNSFKQSHRNLCGTSGFEDYTQQFVLTGPPRIKYF